MNNRHKQILTSYEIARPIYEEFTNYCKNELYQFIKEINLDSLLDHIAFRTKKVESFSQKIQDGFDPHNLDEVRDLSGIRAIFYVDAATTSFLTKIISHKKIRDLECIGYNRVYRSPKFLGQFVTLKLSPEKIASSPDLEKFKNCLCELQITNTLQNSWANIYHQTIYKNKKKLEKDFPREVAIIDERYEKMIEGPLAQVSDHLNYLYDSGNKLLQGHNVFFENFSNQFSTCTTLNEVWSLLNKLDAHIRVFGPKFKNGQEIIESLKAIFHDLDQLLDLSNSEWLIEEVIKKITYIGCALFYHHPENVCAFFEILIQEKITHHSVIFGELKSLTCYDMTLISKISYTPQLILAKWISNVCHEYRASTNIWLDLLMLLLSMELSGSSRVDVDTISIQYGILPYHTQLEEIRNICLSTLLLMLEKQTESKQKINFIRKILHSLRPSSHYEQFDAAHQKMLEKELILIVSHFKSVLDKMKLSELIAFDIEASEIIYWFEQSGLNSRPLQNFLHNNFQTEEYTSLRIFAGYNRNKLVNEADETSKVLKMVSAISLSNWDYWKKKICKISSLYPDLGSEEFDTFEKFLTTLASHKPELAIDLLKYHITDLFSFIRFLLPSLYHSVFQDEIVAILKNYIANGTAIKAIAQGIMLTKPASMEIVELLLNNLIESRDTHLLYLFTCSLHRISANWDQKNIKSIFFTIIEFLSSQRIFNWVDKVLYEKNPLFKCFEAKDYEKILNLIVGADLIGPGSDYALSMIALKNPSELLQFFVKRKSASLENSSIIVWPSDLKRTKKILSELNLHEMESFYMMTSQYTKPANADFIYKIFPKILCSSSLSLLEFIDTLDVKDLNLALKILEQYYDNLRAFDFYKIIICKFKLSPKQINSICAHVLFVSNTIGRDGRLQKLQERLAYINTWSSESDRFPFMKKFLNKFKQVAETAIHDEKSQISRDLFIDIAAFEDNDKRFVESQP